VNNIHLHKLLSIKKPQSVRTEVKEDI
jgi:hypothetical protein